MATKFLRPFIAVLTLWLIICKNLSQKSNQKVKQISINKGITDIYEQSRLNSNADMM